ncbi:uncharacterized protein LOC134748560 [Cydia strobilella]|uniref:uncharacterized protein LOC134748560 n=1 Tax=Cydia strobilella TaxID=1100964 RepID=UPI0030070789
MIGFRTPVKKATKSPSKDTAKSPNKSVRRSIDKWEAASGDVTQTLIPTVIPTTSQAGPAGVPPQTRQAIPNSVEKGPQRRVAEARALLEKAKAQMKLSGNIKREIKATVQEVIEQMYNIVKELAKDLKTEQDRKESSGRVVPGATASDTTFTLDEEQNRPPNTTREREVDERRWTNEEEAREIKTLIQRNTLLLEENTAKMDELKASMETQRETLERVATTATYASVAAAAPNTAQGAGPTSRRGTLHSVVVTSTDETETGDEVLGKIRKAVDAKDGWIKVERVRKAKDRKIIMGLATREEREKIKERLAKEGTNLVVEDAKNKDPLLVLRSVLTINSDEDIVRALRNQNKGIFRDLEDEENRVEIKYRRRTRNPHTCHVVACVSPIIWQRATGVGTVHLDLQRVRVEDQTPLVQCTRCLGFGHGKRYCTAAADLCSHCGGPHLRSECADWLARVPPKCQNCEKAELEDTEHNAFSLLAQANLQRKKLATEELYAEAKQRGIAVALLQEPYVGGAKVTRSYKGVRIFQGTGAGEGTVKAAIAVFDDDIKVTQYPKLTTDNVVAVSIQTSAWEVVLVSLYLEPDQPMEPHLEQLEKVAKELKPQRWIIGGDFNAKSTWWGSPVVDGRGEQLATTLDELGLNILNRGDTPTFDTVRGGKHYTSYVDVTACSIDILDLVDDWRVDQGLTSSDHNGIIFKVKLTKLVGITVQRTTRKFNTKKANWSEFYGKFRKLLQDHKIVKSEIESLNNNIKIEKVVTEFNAAIEEACISSMPKKKVKQQLTLPWWSEELAKMKKGVATRKRRIGCAAPVRRSKVVEEYVQYKEEYERAAAKAQVDSWKDFCHKQSREGVWEGIYRVIGRTARREEDSPLEKDGVVLDAKSSVRLLAETFYPKDCTTSDNDYHRQVRERADIVNDGEQDNTCEPSFTMAELKRAYDSFNPKKAPGEDGFTSDICYHAIETDPETFLALLNKCLSRGYFPRAWKTATVVVLRKPGRGDYTTPKSYRPIGLLPIMGKVFEKMVVNRLKFYLLPQMSDRQYGFMPQRSTEDSLYALMKYIRKKLDSKKIVTLISLDIEGAFDGAWWPAIRSRLAEENCPVELRRVIDSYLTDRRVTVRYAGEQYSLDTTKGCVQGSIAGPILWNLLLDPLLKSYGQRGDYCQAFADDVVLVVDGNTALEIETRANAALDHAREWGVSNKLRFAPHKTNAMVITRRLKYDTPRLSMGGTSIAMVKEMKLLGVTIDDKLTFNSHVSNVCRKAIAVYKQLSRAAKTDWGLHPEVVKIIYVATVEPIILYAASVWAHAANKLGVQKQLAVVQRGMAQKICKAYRTVSLNSALVLAGMLPLDLRVREAASLYEAKKGESLPALWPGDREVEQMASATEMPHPADREELRVVRLVNQDDVNSNSEFDVRIFTDGSRLEGGVGASLSIWKGETETKAHKLALSRYCTVYQAELLALCRATREAKKYAEKSYGVYSDSMAALQTIQNHSCLHPLAVEARENLKAMSLQGKVVTLHWIKAHAGLEGNERADELAKGAAVGSKRKPDYDQCPVSFVKRSIRMSTLDEWNRRYKSGETASITKLFFPDAVAAYRVTRKSEPNNLKTQLMTGHGGFSEYLNRFKCKESPSCVCDNNTQETVPHIIFECPVHDSERFDMEQKIKISITADKLHNIMASAEMDQFIEFCLKIVRRVVKRNKTR